MKRILMRAGLSPFVDYSPVKVIMKNLINNNIGNMLFPASICRTLLREDTAIDTMDTKRRYSSQHIRQINERYDYIVLPFANAFRSSFVSQLDAVTDLVSRVRIPCIVTGIGLQEKLNKEAGVGTSELDKAVIRFMKAVLDKSAIVGLRGEFTADYLTRLGFQAERDFTVIGCPSMYMFGKELPHMEVKELTPDSKVSTNSKIQLPQKFHDFMFRCRELLPNYSYIPQVIEELGQMYMGKSYPDGFIKKIPKHFPVDFTHPIYQSGRGVSFVNVPSWLEFLGEKDFSFGSRIHGNIAAILAGTPCFIVVSDKRIMELVDYHNIPHILMDELKNDTNIFRLYEKADFSAIRKGHEKRFMYYLDFLKANDLPTIYDEKGNAPEDTPYDKQIRKVKFTPAVKAFSALSSEEQLKRLRDIYENQRRNELYLKGMSPGIMDFAKDWGRQKILGEPSKAYERHFPFIRRYKRR